MRFRPSLLASALTAALALTGGQASATAITGTSQGSFSDLADCKTSGGSQNCRIVNTSANGASTQVQWGSTSNSTNFSSPKTLTAVDISVSTTTSADDVIIARLDWFNSSTRSNKTPGDMSFDWTLSLAFTSPNVTNVSEVFTLTMINTTSFQLTSLDDLVFDLNGVTVSDLKFKVVDGSGSCTGDDTTFSNNTWYNCAGNTASLYITADFADTPPSAPGEPVPEPTTIALFAAGLIGLGFLRRRTTGKRRFKRSRASAFS